VIVSRKLLLIGDNTFFV